MTQTQDLIRFMLAHPTIDSRWTPEARLELAAIMNPTTTTVEEIDERVTGVERAIVDLRKEMER